MSGLALAIVVAELLTMIATGAMAVLEWRRRRSAPTSLPRALVWVALTAWIYGTIDLAPSAGQDVVVASALSLGSFGLTWNALARSRMTGLLRPQLAVVFAVVPLLTIGSMLTGYTDLVLHVDGPAARAELGPLGWSFMLWLYLFVCGAAALQIVAVGQAVGPRRHDIVEDGLALQAVTAVIALAFLLPRSAQVDDLVPLLVAAALGSVWHRQKAPSRRVPLQVTSSNVLERVSDAVLLLGTDNLVIDANARARRELLGEDESARRPVLRGRPVLDPRLVDALGSDGERVVTLASGRVELVRLSTVHELGRPVARILSARDITELEQLRAQLADQAARDPLTGLRNRRHLAGRLGALVERAREDTSPLALAMVDLDNLKQLNDSFGHRVGDQTLIGVAGVLRTDRGPDDIVVRTGGDEFIVAMPGATLADAARRAESWRALAGDLNPSGAVRVTLSIGVCAWHGGMTADELIDGADRALYVAKASGRDQVRVADEQGSRPWAAEVDR